MVLLFNEYVTLDLLSFIMIIAFIDFKTLFYMYNINIFNLVKIDKNG